MRSALLSATALLLAACASTGPQSQLGTEQKAKENQQIRLTRTSDCVFQSTISDFTTLDDTHVVLFASGRRQAYLAELTGGCFDVRSQSSLMAVDGDQNGQICGFGRDSVAYRRMGLVEECRIMGLQQLSDERRVELGVGAPAPKPKKDKKAEPVPPPADTK